MKGGDGGLGSSSEGRGRAKSPHRFLPGLAGGLQLAGGEGEAGNRRNLLLDALWIGIFNGLVGTFTNVFAVRLGAPDIYIGLMVAGPALVTALLSLPSARVVQRFSARRVAMATWGRIFVHLAYLSIAAFPFFLGHLSTALAVVIMVMVGSIPGGLLSVAVTSIIAAVTEPKSRSRIIGMRFAVMGVTTALSVIAGGWLLDRLTFPFNYQLLFLIAGVSAFASIHYFAALRIPEDQLLSESEPMRSSVRGFSRLRQSLAEVGQHRAFFIYSLAYFAYHLGIFGAHPLFSIYWVRHLHLSDAAVGLMGTVSTVATVLAYFPWGHYADRGGNRAILLSGSLGVGLFPILTALSRTLPSLLLIQVFAGIFAAGLNIVCFNVLIEVTPEKGRAPLIALHTVIHNLAAFVAPLIITSISQAYGVVLLLFVTGVVRVLGAALFALVPLGRPQDRPASADGRAGLA